jgi:hypothetical protein
MEDLREVLSGVTPVDEHLVGIWRSIPDETLAEEQARLRERFLDIGSRLLSISEVRETK